MVIDGSYKIVFPGKPIPLARPRLGKWGVYDSQKLLKKKSVDALLRQKDKWKKIEGAIGMDIEFRMPISKSKGESMLKVHHVKRPDLSNMVKYYEDVMQGHLYNDDCQIVETIARKVHSLVTETVVHIWRKDGDL